MDFSFAINVAKNTGVKSLSFSLKVICSKKIRESDIVLLNFETCMTCVFVFLVNYPEYYKSKLTSFKLMFQKHQVPLLANRCRNSY